jgi:hypothetical protein
MNERRANLYIDILMVSQEDVTRWVKETGITFDKWEPQPMAEQIKLHGVKNLPTELPPFARAR